jgi:hypothetical protein
MNEDGSCRESSGFYGPSVRIDRSPGADQREDDIWARWSTFVMVHRLDRWYRGSYDDLSISKY